MINTPYHRNHFVVYKTENWVTIYLFCLDEWTTDVNKAARFDWDGAHAIKAAHPEYGVMNLELRDTTE